MAPSNSSSPKTNQKPKATVVAMEERRTMNAPNQGSPQEVELERTITEVASEREIMNEKISAGLRVLEAASRIMKNDPPRDDVPFMCDICKRGFCSASALSRHQNIHKADQDLERMLKKREPSYSPVQGFWKKPCNSYQGTSNWVDVGGYSQDALSNDKDHGISRDGALRGDGRSIRSIRFPPFNSGSTRDNTDIDMAAGYPRVPYGNTNHGFSSGALSVTHNNKHLTLFPKNDNYNNRMALPDFNRVGLSFGPFQSGRGGSSHHPSSYNGGITMAPPATPYRYFTQNNSYASSSRDPLPSYRFSPDALSLELSLSPPNDIRSCSKNSSTQGLLSLDLSLGPSKSTGSSNNNSSVNPSLNGGVTGGGLPDLNLPVRPRVSRYHVDNHNPLDSITRNVLLSHPPPPTTNPPNDENVLGSDRKGKKPKL